MPRTKTNRKAKLDLQAADETDSLVRDFERQAHMRILKMESEAKMAMKGLENSFNITISRLPKEIQLMTLGELMQCEINDQKENCEEVSSSVNENSLKPPTTTKGKKHAKRITTASDDGYVTEGRRTSRAQKDESQRNMRRTRSNSRNREVKLSQINQETIKKIRKPHGKESVKTDQFKTPATLKVNNISSNTYGLVTPKVKPNTPLNVLRRPRQGEMVLSMQGSPLLVSAVVQENTANINVPLRNGNVISLLPKEGLRMSHIPSLDPETMRQLETLKNHIEKVISTK
ncbi:borealin-related [Megalopta genalis]|uniref:borealin-related n=1 Tax=Megalopta genalis TaxID=115081 RepID=UPI001443616D|nr:borealin [Megalopta genalis]